MEISQNRWIKRDKEVKGQIIKVSRKGTRCGELGLNTKKTISQLKPTPEDFTKNN